MPDLMKSASRRRLDEIDTYQDTVLFLLALVNELSWDDMHHSIREDVTHEHGSPQPIEDDGDPVTPDMALLLGDTVGIIGEAKVGFASSAQARKRIRDQILRYDGVAQRWRGDGGASPRVRDACVVLLTHTTRKIDASDYLTEEEAKGEFRPRCHFAVVAAARSSQRQEYITLERSYGSLIPPEKDEKLRRVVSIPLESIKQRYGSIRFYDAEPPLIYLMQIIWDLVVPILVPEEGFYARGISGKGREGNRRILIDVTADDIARKLRDYFSMKLLNPSLPECPRKQLVVSAIENLARLKLATNIGEGKYRIEYRKLRSGTLDFFLHKLIPSAPKQRGRDVVKEQLKLFPEDMIP